MDSTELRDTFQELLITTNSQVFLISQNVCLIVTEISIREIPTSLHRATGWAEKNLCLTVNILRLPRNVDLVDGWSDWMGKY